MKLNNLNLVIITALLLIIGLACGSEIKMNEKKYSLSETKKIQIENPVKLDSYALHGIEFVYYKIPASITQDELIEIAQNLHDAEPDKHLILVDDDSQVADYIKYVKAVSSGDAEAKMPKNWADQHIIANIQKYLSGKFVLCEGSGYTELAELK